MTQPFLLGKAVSIAVFLGPWVSGVVADVPAESSEAVAGACDGECDYCWCGTQYEQNCPIDWFYDADCDCGCQFCDAACMCSVQECGSSPIVGACCCPDSTCVGSVTRTDCIASGCAYRGDGSSCASGCPCDAMPLPCDWCWVGTSAQNNCPVDWYGAGDGCDCGCQWTDPDCAAPTGACCCPDSTCADHTTQVDCLAADCVYRGNGSSCASGCPCDAMELPCDWCWVGTLAQNNCPTEWYGAGDGCDCGCQWLDPDCSSPTGACCGPSQTIPECVGPATEQACMEAGGAYMGDDMSCAVLECGGRCASACDWCWCGTLADDNCDPAWNGDGVCDCGCQFCDSDCPNCAVQACCVARGDSTGDGLVDLGDHRRLPSCMHGPGSPVIDSCAWHDFDGDGDLDLGDVAGFQRAFGQSP